MTKVEPIPDPRAVQSQAPALTLADVLKVVNAAENLSPTRRRDLASALRSLARILNQDLAIIPAERRALMDMLRRVATVQAGLSPKRWANIRADLSAALDLVKGIVGTYRRPPLSPAWTTLYRELSTTRLQNGLTGLIHYCNGAGVVPEAVTDAIATGYREHLEERRLRANPKAILRRTCRLWNEMVATSPGWPKQQLTVPNHKKKPFMLALPDLPEGFRAEITTYLNWLAGNDLLATKQPRQICKPRTCELRRTSLQYLATAAVKGGVAIESLDSIAALVNETVARRGLKVCLERTGGKPTPFLFGIVKDLNTIARHWLGMAESERQWLRQLRTRLNPGQRGLTQKNRDCLRQFESDRNKALILHLPDTLARRARALTISPARIAVKFQLALAIDLELTAPMRIGNLSSLHLEKNFSRPEGPRGPVYIVLHEETVKNSEPLEFPLTGSTKALLNEYLRIHRPNLAGADSSWLFPGSRNRSKRARSLSQQITNTVYRETGLRLTPHQFRHLAAKLLLDRHPGAYELVRRLLGHRSLATTTGYYTGLETRAAVAHYDEVILELRQGMKPTPPRRPRTR